MLPPGHSVLAVGDVPCTPTGDDRMHVRRPHCDAIADSCGALTGTESYLAGHKEAAAWSVWTSTTRWLDSGVLPAGRVADVPPARPAPDAPPSPSTPFQAASMPMSRSGEANATRLRPACLAAYMAESAAASRSVSSKDSPRAMAVTPIEMVTLSV